MLLVLSVLTFFMFDMVICGNSNDKNDDIMYLEGNNGDIITGKPMEMIEHIRPNIHNALNKKESGMYYNIFIYPFILIYYYIIDMICIFIFI